MSEGICWGRVTAVLCEEDGGMVFDIVGRGFQVKSYLTSLAILHVVRGSRRGGGGYTW